MNLYKKLSKKSFAVYGLGITGASVINYLKKLKVKKLNVWDDNKNKRFKFKNLIGKKSFSKILKASDYIVLSPGVNFNNSKFKRQLIKNRKKIITDLDLFYNQNPKGKTIVVTGTNGKSTTCKIIEHVLKKIKNLYKLEAISVNRY